MYRIDIIVSTRGRYAKFMKMVESIPGNTNGVEIWLNVAFDGDMKSWERFAFTKRANVAQCVYVAKQSGNVANRNMLAEKCEDAVLYATDDIIFRPGSISQAIHDFREHFKDDDGVIGFTQVGNNKFSPTGVALLGKTFLCRYPNKHLFYPKYFHFAAQEIHELALHLGKFYLSAATVDHLNPFVRKEYRDQTHIDARIHKERDHELSFQRKRNRMIWGLNG